MEIKVFPGRYRANNIFFASCHRNQIATWGFKCFKTSRKQFFTLVSVGVKSYKIMNIKVFRDLAITIYED